MQVGIIKGAPLLQNGVGTANTSIVFHAGRLLALHEGDLPYQVRARPVLLGIQCVTHTLLASGCVTNGHMHGMPCCLPESAWLCSSTDTSASQACL
jgi:hypothetical protein